ncbi:secretin and TonB N-terminal domain-containing protein [Desulfurobacterium sp.]|uniref:secretin and TonB N-terminal domain-containing protein n=1 Tax=Desulfurobacterium sp. TaxID=2004706 RepID=UPI002620ABAE|nr:secretin and TonB N-terminal domain-containing protein [Desulfurobacterium sp.]
MRKILLLPAISILTFGCSHSSKIKVTPDVSKPKETKPISISITPMPLEPPTLQEIKRFTEKSEELPESNLKVHLSFKDADVKDALLALAKATDYNVIIPPDIEGKVTVDLDGKSLEECLDALLSPLGYSYKLDGRVIKIITRETKVFHLLFPTSQREFESSIDATIGSSGTGGSIGGSEGSSGASGTASMRVANRYNVNFWNEVKEVLNSILKEDNKALYSIEQSTGTIVVTAKPREISRVAQFVEKLNSFSSKQVTIEAKILEVKLNRKNQTGINWKLLTDNNFFGAGATVSFSSGSPDSMPFNFQVVKADKKISSIIGLLSQFGKVNVLSSPRIVAVNGQPAMIKVGKDYIVIYSSQTTSSTATGSQAATTITTQEIETSSVTTEGVVLTIVPKIIGRDQVLLNITPAISSLDTPLITNSGSGDTSEFMNKVFAVNVRQLNTIVRAKNGETVILGGLIAESKSKESEGVPVLKDIPLLGIPFKSTTTTTSKTELVIMLTPHIETGE